MSKRYGHDFNELENMGTFDLPWGNMLVFTRYNHLLGKPGKGHSGMVGGRKYRAGPVSPEAEEWVKYTEIDEDGNVMAGCNEIDPELFGGGKAREMMEKFVEKHIEESTVPRNAANEYNKNLSAYLLKDMPVDR